MSLRSLFTTFGRIGRSSISFRPGTRVASGLSADAQHHLPVGLPLLVHVESLPNVLERKNFGHVRVERSLDGERRDAREIPGVVLHAEENPLGGRFSSRR